MIDNELVPGCEIVGDELIERNWLAMENGIVDLGRLIEDLKAAVLAIELGQPPPDLDSAKYLRPHTPRWFSSVYVPYRFDLGAKCERWLETLQQNMEGDAERIAILQEWCGYCLQADTSQQKFLFLEGDGSNGKSVFMAGLEALISRDLVSHVSIEHFGLRFHLAQTLGCYVNIAADVGELDKVAEGFLKSFTSGDRMFFEKKGQDGFSASPSARVVLSANARPRISDRSNGVWRRMILIPFQKPVPEEFQIKGMDKPEYWERSGELPGMFNWALVGLVRLRTQGRFSRSLVSDAAILDYRTESNPVRAFLVQECRENPNATVDCKEIYDDYKAFCIQGTYRPMNDNTFGKELRRIFHRVEKKRKMVAGERIYFYSGIEKIEDDFE